ncbi:hypothetical protein EA79_02775 [Enterococcus faecalis]|uniref:hypothetical protein n=1 Tax=Enterococcus faecalis TaxID=1351 RepID=UPI000DEBED9B|nr:hypothetical protein [Enterococcus faecalis]RBR98014.1 hypothetical protein EA79_02775 [Enterococcus faecalis]
MVWIMIMIPLIALVFLFLFIMALFNEKSDIVVNTYFTGVIVFSIALIVMPCLYIKQENEWKDTIQQRLEEKHYLLPEKVNEKFRPIIEIEDRQKKKAIPFSVTFIFNGEDVSKREKFPGLYLKGTLKGTEVKNIQIANENYLNKQKQFKKLADNTIDLYQVDFLYSGELSGITTDNQKVRVNQDGTELFVNDKKIEGDAHK